MNLTVERAYPTPLAQSALLPLLLLSLAKQKNSPDVTDTFRKEYDYIVVGAGTAGSVIAARLSEIPCVNVLLLEAGGTPPKLNELPGIVNSFWFTDIDWNFKTAPQKHTGYGLVNNQLSWPSGKVVGGTSILSVGVHIVGNRKDFDGWAAMGAKGWSYREVLPFFMKFEDNRDPKYVANGFHGVGGPVTVETPRYDSVVKRTYFRAVKALGYQIVDPNARRQTGFFYPQGYLRKNVRCSTAKAYLVPAENRTNLDIVSNAFVRKILIKNGRATGVLFDFEGRVYRVAAKREVVLSAGAVNSAKILMLSGIGPKKELQRLNIPVHADLPVGKNFHDHVATTVDFLLSSNIRPIVEKIQDPENIKRFIYNRTGPLASTLGMVSMSFNLNDEVNPKIDFPNIDLHSIEGSFVQSAEDRNLKPEVYDQVFRPYERNTKMGCLVSNSRPKSRGTVSLKSTNPYVPPVIDPNYFDDPNDLEEIIEGMKLCKKIGISPIMRELGSRPFQTLYPGCEEFENNDDAYFRCQARSVIYTFGHPVGTAKMGDPRDPTTVVDPKLRVKYIRGLRVIDNSIMPTITTGFTAAPAIMIGEKGSAFIKESIQCHPYQEDHTDNDYYVHHPSDYGHEGKTQYPDENDDDDDDDDNSYDSPTFGSYDDDRQGENYNTRLFEDYNTYSDSPSPIKYNDDYRFFTNGE